MKKFIRFTLMALAVSSCSKDSISPDQESVIAKSEILVTVTRYQYDGICPTGCSGENGQPIFQVGNAAIKIAEGILTDTINPVTPVHSGLTDKTGTVLIEDVEPGTYTIKVETQFGYKYRTLYTQLHKRAYIDFSF